MCSHRRLHARHLCAAANDMRDTKVKAKFSALQPSRISWPRKSIKISRLPWHYKLQKAPRDNKALHIYSNICVFWHIQTGKHHEEKIRNQMNALWIRLAMLLHFGLLFCINTCDTINNRLHIISFSQRHGFRARAASMRQDFCFEVERDMLKPPIVFIIIRYAVILHVLFFNVAWKKKRILILYSPLVSESQLSLLRSLFCRWFRF